MNSPSPDEVTAFRATLRTRHEHLRSLVGAEGASMDQFAEVVDEVGEQLLVADEELRVQAENLAQSSEELAVLTAAHEELFVTAPTACVQTDLDGLIIRYNHAARLLLGLPNTVGRSLSLAGTLREQDRPALRTLISRLRLDPELSYAGPIEVTHVRGQHPPTPVVISGRRSTDAADRSVVLHWELTAHGAAPDPAAAPVDPREVGALSAIAEAAAELARLEDAEAVAQLVVVQARTLVVNADRAALARQRGRGFEVPAATDELAATGARAYCRLTDGPVVAAVEQGRPVLVTSRPADPGPGTLLAVPLASPRGDAAVLLLYADREDAFDEIDENVARAYAVHAGVALAHTELEANLRIGLQTREEIGRAVGILMERHRVTAGGAFDMLVMASQHSHRKLRDVAAWMNETGEDPVRLVRDPRRGSRHN